MYLKEVFKTSDRASKQGFDSSSNSPWHVKSDDIGMDSLLWYTDNDKVICEVTSFHVIDDTWEPYEYQEASL